MSCLHNCLIILVVGNSLKLGTLVWYGNQKWNIFEIIAKCILGYIRIHIPMMVCMLQLKEIYFAVVVQIEQYVNITRVTWKSKTHPDNHFNIHNNVKEDFIGYN